ncbi:MAG: nicotinate (nicotinamide) nucleotide adenylyltransferase [Clostridia bacterium]|nr:nicotinate (nicotinamide) nucleotide adenylyltransferase [Clostridia bacterium]
MKRIAFFGGTFNPVHTEHRYIAAAAVKELGLDKIIVVPTFLPPHKNVFPAKSEDRVNMLDICFKQDAELFKNTEISDFEIKNGGKSYSYLTAEHFKSVYPDAELFMLIGGDMLKDFKTWKNPERILACAKLAVVMREDCSVDIKAEREYFKKNFNKDFTLLDYVGKDVSSTEIRTRLAFGIKPNGVDDKVFSYIKENAVYKPDKYEQYILDKLPEKRVVHTANVVICALKKARELDLDNEKVRIAATLHDCAKYDDYMSYKDFSLPSDVPQPVVHAFLGAFVAETVLGVKDEEILDAIRYHTSGKANMSTLSKLIFVADMLEEGRDYEGVDVLREAYEKDFESAFRLCLKEEVLHLMNKKQYIYKETLNAYDFYLKD